MKSVYKLTLADIIQQEIEKNKYLKEIYSTLMEYNTNKVLGYHIFVKSINIVDACRFADLLIKINGTELDEKYHMLGQAMIILLNNIYKNNQDVKYTTGTLLNYLGNLKGLDNVDLKEFKSLDDIEDVAYSLQKEILSIPDSTDRYFFPMQKAVYDNLSNKCYSYSGPTSMGKSFVVQVYIKKQIIDGSKKNYAIIVPTKALINEYKNKLIAEINDDLSGCNYSIVTSPSDLALTKNKNFILVMTPERFIYFLMEYSMPINFLFIDEAQSISKVDKRSIYYYKIFSIIMERKKTENIIFASPNIPNPEIYLKPILVDDKKYALTTQYSPVFQFKYYIDVSNEKLFFYNDLEETLTMSDKPCKVRDLKDAINKFGKNKSNLVYINSKMDILDYIEEFASALDYEPTAEQKSLSKRLEDELHKDSVLPRIILKGVAYHVGFLPLKIRVLIEEAFSYGIIHTVFCTSTLLEGVNLPADNLFITSLKCGRGQKKFDAITFRNLIGRVGRISHSLYGNVFYINVIKESSTEEIKDDKVDFFNLLRLKPEKQKLSVENSKFIKATESIISDLQKQEIHFPSLKNSNISNSHYDMYRKAGLAFISDFVKGNESFISKFFIGNNIDVVSDNLKQNKVKSDDIDFSSDQITKVENLVSYKGYSGYPKLSEKNSNEDIEKVKLLLEQMSSIFMWSKYEPSLIRKDGKIKGLNWYSILLYLWMSGASIPKILNMALNYKEKNPNSGVWFGHKCKHEKYTGTPKEKSIVIANVLDELENKISFTYAKYFRKYSKLIKEINPELLKGNDWYEFITFGTKNQIVICLQKYGISRDVALLTVKEYSYYLRFDNDIKIRIGLLGVLSLFEGDDIRDEFVKLQQNMPEIWIL